MDLGAFTGGLLTPPRGVEAALIIAIILAYLNKTGTALLRRIWLRRRGGRCHQRHRRDALLVTVGALRSLRADLRGRHMLLAAGVVT